MKALVGAFNQEKALVGAFYVIVQPVVEPMEHYTALVMTVGRLPGDPGARVLRPLPRPGAGGRDVQHQRGGPVRRPHDLRPGQSSVATVHLNVLSLNHICQASSLTYYLRAAI